MASLSSILPPPKHASLSTASTVTSAESATRAIVTKGPPPYGHRQGFIPRTLSDYGDGGAFPEIHVAQFPRDMGRKTQKKGNALALQVDHQGNIQYDAIVKQGHEPHRLIQSSLKDMKPMDTVKMASDALQKPSEKELTEITERTREALQQKSQARADAANPSIVSQTHSEIVRYTPANQQDTAIPQRLIRMVTVAEDPLDPPRFKHKKLPAPPRSPPPPQLHSPPRKPTASEQEQWRIPPCISNWKNPKGFTIPLDKRLASDGRGLHDVSINDNFAKVSEALYLADRHAREEIEKRAAVQRKVAERELREKEEHLKQLAQQARQERAAVVSAQANYRDDAVQEREQVRQDKKREYEKQVKRGTTMHSRFMDRDIEKQTVSGTTSGPSQVQFDARLFHQESGFQSGLGQQEDGYHLYDQPLLKGSHVSMIYTRPVSGAMKERHEWDDSVDAVHQMMSLGGDPKSTTTSSNPANGPVLFEREQRNQQQQDPFGVDAFLSQATKKQKQ